MVFHPERKTTVFVVLLVALAIPTTAQNLLVNSGFDADVSSWTPGLGTIAWDPLDWAGNPASGSMRITNTQAAAGMVAVVQQCISLPTTAPYELGTRVRFPSGQTSSGLVAIRTFFFDNTTCRFPSFGGVAGPTVTSSITDTWGDSFITGVNPSPGALSTLVAIYVVKNDAGGTLSGLVDRVVFGPAGTTPVQLDSFTVE